MVENLNSVSFLQEEIKRSPKLVQDLTKIGQEVELRVADSLVPYGLEAVTREIGSLRQTVEKRYLDYPPEKLDVMFHLVFNFLQSKPEAIQPREKRIDNYDKELLARTSHAFVHHMIDAGYDDSDLNFVEAMYSLYKNVLWVNSFISRRTTATDLPALWKGVENETAVAKTLMDSDFAVYVPDYTQDIGDDADMEVLQLDVKNGIDILALSSNDVLFLIDITGYPDKEIDTQFFYKPELRDSTAPAIRRAIGDVAVRNDLIKPEERDNVSALNGLKIIQTTLRLPSGGRTILPSDPNIAFDVPRMRKILGAFGKQRPADSIAVIDSLGSLAKHYDSLKTRPL